ncbi:MAG: NUDIX hydrolase [bacterium]|nr:NUDIX hydrolase [bacterium]
MTQATTKVAFVRLRQENKVLLLQEGGRLAMGLWCFPGGHVDEGESFEQAAAREAQEESGYQISLGPIIFQSHISKEEYKGARRDEDIIELVIFDGNITAGELTKDEQALDIRWLSPEEAVKLPLRWEFLKDLL